MIDTQRLKKIKRRLGIMPDDTKEDDLLSDLVEDAESYFKGLTEKATIDNKYYYMIENVVYKLYGRKGSEGVTSETVDGYSVTYQDWDNLFKPYMAILNKDFGLDGSLREKGKVMFL
ncbi:phage head-tail connector protein [Streptococcus lutetiensis]|uniref:phage head-tail connector protein n=1 Tax=Streptococcus lutetiensis TaxID=150055 RepID=UPI0022DFFFD2|nr:phage head-tail connector protein [Streptococcus lutetiensis]